MGENTSTTMPSLPTGPQTAIVADAHGALVVSPNVGIPLLEPDTVLIRSFAVALNPVDAKLTGPMGFHGAISGSDVSGTVVGVGPQVTRFRVGDRACAAVQSMNPLRPLVGAYAQYVAATEDFCLKIPDGMSWEDAATLGIGTATIGYALFWSLKVPGHPDRPADESQDPSSRYVLVYGASTASGTMALQVLRRAGLVPLAVCSPHNFDLVASYGAAKAFDYHDADAPTQIKAFTKNALRFALDCFCEGASTAFCYACIGRAGGAYTTLEPYPAKVAAARKLVKADWIVGPALFGLRLGWPAPYDMEPNLALRAFGREWYLCVQRLLDRGELRPHPVRVLEGGFEAVLEGLEMLKRKEVSGAKLVCCVGDADAPASASASKTKTHTRVDSKFDQESISHLKLSDSDSALPADLPSSQRVILQDPAGTLVVAANQPVIPSSSLQPHQLLVRVHAVTLNPCDWKTPALTPCAGSWCGCDFAGVVIARGARAAASDRFRVGDRVFGACKGSSLTNLQGGAFAQYLAADEDYTFHAPDGLGWPEAAALCGTAIATVATAIYTLGIPGVLGVPAPATTGHDAQPAPDQQETILVYGGSSSVGLVAIQLLRLLGHRVVTTCSPHNFALVKSYGASLVFDYHAPTCAADIRAATANKLRFALDPFGEARTLLLCQGALGRAGGRYAAFERYDASLCARKTVSHCLVMAAAVDGLGVDMPAPYGQEPDEKLRKWTMAFYRELDGWLAKGRVRPCPVDLLEGGMEGILAGLERLRRREVSGRKLVALIS